MLNPSKTLLFRLQKATKSNTSDPVLYVVGYSFSKCLGTLARINMVPTQNGRNYPLFAPAAFIHLQVWDNFFVFLKKGHKDKQTKMAGAEQEEFLQFLTKHFYMSQSTMTFRILIMQIITACTESCFCHQFVNHTGCVLSAFVFLSQAKP